MLRYSCLLILSLIFLTVFWISVANAEVGSLFTTFVSPTCSLSQNPPINLKSFVRYVDDSHARFQNDEEADRFLEQLNDQDESIKNTMERETSDGLNFLDVNIKNAGLRKYEFSIHRKNAITNVHIKPHSSHDPKVLKGVFRGFVHRAFTLCTDQHIEGELKFLVDSFKENGYPESLQNGIIESYRSKIRNREDSHGSDVHESEDPQS